MLNIWKLGGNKRVHCFWLESRHNEKQAYISLPPLLKNLVSVIRTTFPSLHKTFHQTLLQHLHWLIFLFWLEREMKMSTHTIICMDCTQTVTALSTSSCSLERVIARSLPAPPECITICCCPWLLGAQAWVSLRVEQWQLQEDRAVWSWLGRWMRGNIWFISAMITRNIVSI